MSLPLEGGGHQAGWVVLIYGLCLDRYCDQWLPLALPEEECGHGLCAFGVQSAGNPSAGRGAAEAADGCGQQDALCPYELLYPQVTRAYSRAVPFRSLTQEGVLQRASHHCGWEQEEATALVWLRGPYSTNSLQLHVDSNLGLYFQVTDQLTKCCYSPRSH